MFCSFEQVVLILINLYQSLERVLFDCFILFINYNTKIRNILLAHLAILALRGFGF